MKKFKSLMAVLLTGAMLFAFAGCSGNNDVKSSAADGDNANVSGAASGGKIIMTTEAGFAPYEYMEGNNIVGVDVDIANEIAKAMGKELEIQNSEFAQALMAVTNGKADFAAAGISVTPDRQETMDFSIPYATSKQVVVVKKDSNAVTDPKNLEGKVVGAQLGTVADIVISDPEEGYKAKEVKQYEKYVQAASDLKNDKIDCIVMDALPAAELVKANEGLVVLDGEVFTDTYAIGVKKGNQELLDQINTVLQKLIDDGKIDEFTVNHTTK